MVETYQHLKKSENQKVLAGFMQEGNKGARRIYEAEISTQLFFLT